MMIRMIKKNYQNILLLLFILTLGCQKKIKLINLKKNIYYEQALIDIKDGNNHQAINNLEICLKNKFDPEALALQANLFYKEKNYFEAIKIFKKIINNCKQESLKCDVLNNLACALLFVGQIIEAQEIWLGLTTNKLYYTPEVAYFNLGLQEFRIQNFNRAIQYFEKSILIQPSYTDARWYLSLSLYYLKNYLEAQKNLQILKLELPDNLAIKNFYDQIDHLINNY